MRERAIIDQETTAPWRARRVKPPLLRGAGSVVLIYLGVLVIARLAYPSFFSANNLENLLRQNTPLALLALGMTFTIIGGEFDLSTGGVFGLAAVIFAKLGGQHSIAEGVLFALLAGGLAGIVNSLFVLRGGVNSFIATLATGLAITGIGLSYAHSTQISVTKASFSDIGLAKVAGVPVDVLGTVLIFIVAGVVLARTRYGRSIYSVGDHPDAAHLVGMRVGLIKTGTFVMSGMLAALAGVVAASKAGVGDATTGQALPLTAVAVIVIGGTSIAGGEGAVWRTGIGVLILATLDNLFSALSWDPASQEVATGALIVLAVAAKAASSWRRSGRSSDWRRALGPAGRVGRRVGPSET